MQELDALEVLPPLVEFVPNRRSCGHSVGSHQRVHGARLAVCVEFRLQQRVDRIVQRERKSRRAPDTQPAIDVETSRALDEELQATA